MVSALFAAVVRVPSLAQELPHAMSPAKKKKKTERERENKKNEQPKPPIFL